MAQEPTKDSKTLQPEACLDHQIVKSVTPKCVHHCFDKSKERPGPDEYNLQILQKNTPWISCLS